MAWNFFCYFFGAVSIIGPICLIFWYVGAAKEQLKKLNND